MMMASSPADELRPKTVAEALECSGEYRAGGTDLQQRRQSGRSAGPVIDISRLPELAEIAWLDSGAVRIGTLVTLRRLASDSRLAACYPALAQTARAVATPQIRARATLGGNLLQHNRCWYYRNPHFTCFRSGGESCPARQGSHPYASMIDLGPCIAVHPSSLAAALLAYDACVATSSRSSLLISDLCDDGGNPGRHHGLADGELLTEVHVPAPVHGERAAYRRCSMRAEGEWPLAEAVARIAVTGGVITTARLTLGAVAPVPLRLAEAEKWLIGQPATGLTVKRVVTMIPVSVSLLPQTRYKLRLATVTLGDALTEAIGLSCR